MAALFQALSQPARLRILLALGQGEACVCHLESVLDLRQAYISQQLMALRKARLVISRRDGRNIYYRLRDSQLLEILQQVGNWLSVEPFDLSQYDHTAATLPECICPRCTGELAEQAFVTMDELSHSA